MVRRYRIVVNGVEYQVQVEEIQGQTQINPLDRAGLKKAGKESIPLDLVRKGESKPTQQKNGNRDTNTVLSPLPGVVISVHVQKEQEVEKGQVLLTLESMKMENRIVAPKAGVVQEIKVREGQTVSRKELLLVLT